MLRAEPDFWNAGCSILDAGYWKFKGLRYRMMERITSLE